MSAATATVTRFDKVVAAAILANSGLVVADLATDRFEVFFETAHNVLLAVFVVELGVRLRRAGGRFFRGGWNLCDAALIIFGFLPALGVDASLLRVARLARLAHLCKHLTHFAPHLPPWRQGPNRSAHRLIKAAPDKVFNSSHV